MNVALYLTIICNTVCDNTTTPECLLDTTASYKPAFVSSGSPQLLALRHLLVPWHSEALVLRAFFGLRGREPTQAGQQKRNCQVGEARREQLQHQTIRDAAWWRVVQSEAELVCCYWYAAVCAARSPLHAIVDRPQLDRKSSHLCSSQKSGALRVVVEERKILVAEFGPPPGTEDKPEVGMVDRLVAAAVARCPKNVLLVEVGIVYRTQPVVQCVGVLPRLGSNSLEKIRWKYSCGEVVQPSHLENGRCLAGHEMR